MTFRTAFAVTGVVVGGTVWGRCVTDGMVVCVVATDGVVTRGVDVGGEVARRLAADGEVTGRVGIVDVATMGSVVLGIVGAACLRPPSAIPAIMATTSTMANAVATFLMADDAKRRLGTVLVHVTGGGGGGI
jgi:hypothetical protein